jgi:hypothetical protein
MTRFEPPAISPFLTILSKDDLLLLLVGCKLNLVHRTKKYNRIGNLDELGSRSFVEQCIISIGISLSRSPLFLRMENIGGSMLMWG